VVFKIKTIPTDTPLEGFLNESRADLISSLRSERILKSKIVEEALLAVPREQFLWPDTPKSLAYLDEPVPLGDTGQTISAPHMIVTMLEELELSPYLRVLEVGAGSGYNAALISFIVSRGVSKPKERLVVAIERNSSLVSFARRNLERVNLTDYCTIIEGDGSLGYPQESESEIYDRIIVAAGAPRIPVFLKKQLKVGGIMEVPVGSESFQRLMIVNKMTRGELKQRRSVDCVFVPLVGRDAHQS
jgi:protein-L-isoaspartate(D-aspartate) O-methyltransferase